jgi:hypothetical protein
MRFGARVQHAGLVHGAVGLAFGQVAGPALVADGGERPSRVAPMRTRWMVAGRCVVLLIISARCSATFTGRLRGARAQRGQQASARRNSLPPKPPPTKGETSRTFSFGMPSVLARSPRPQSTIWLDVQTVSWSPFQAAWWRAAPSWRATGRASCRWHRPAPARRRTRRRSRRPPSPALPP